jgi:hypothetical protein
MLTYNQLFENTLRTLIEAEIDRLTENLVLGLSVEDFATYREIVGQLRGLRKALELCDEAQSIITKT